MSCEIAPAIKRMRRAGVMLSCVDGRLIIDSASPLTTEQLAFIREHKDTLLAHIPERRPLTPAETKAINAWLDRIGEHDLALRAEVLELADTDPEQRIAWLRSAAETEKPANGQNKEP